jgi:[ribosomal protein S18]-alanine N-acetyltransferase
MDCIHNQIVKTCDQSDFDICARMMTRTDPWITLGMGFSDCLMAFRGECKEVYVLRSEAKIAGFVILQVCGTFSGYIQTICIDEDYRGQGLGTSLLEFCEKRIHKFSPNVFICVSSFNENARKLYLRFGFKPVGLMENFIREGYDELLMRKSSGPRITFKSLE